MALTILGLSGALSHDPSAALYIDGKLIAAAEGMEPTPWLQPRRGGTTDA